MQRSQTQLARVVLLGASNLVLGRRQATDAARARIGGAVDVLCAAGHGRSYGLEGRVLGRTLPAILECGLWRALATRAALPTFAIVTDLGNDIAFGASPLRVQGWLESALDRLQALGAEVVVTGLPLAPLQRLAPWRFRLIASLFFPLHGIVRERTLEAVAELEERIAAVAAQRGLLKLDPRPQWYGHDPIHIRPARRAEAWSTYAGGWRPAAAARSAGVAPAPWRGRPRYEQVRVLGLRRGCPQPSAYFDDGGALSLF